MYYGTHVEVRENPVALDLSFYHVGPWINLRSSVKGKNAFYPLSHLASLETCVDKSLQTHSGYSYLHTTCKDQSSQYSNMEFGETQ